MLKCDFSPFFSRASSCK